MTDMTTSAVLIAPAALLPQANALGQAMGWGPGSYSVPLSPTSAAPITHWGLRTWAADGFAAMVEAAGRGELPTELQDAFAPADVAALVGALIVSIRSGEWDAARHWAEVLATAGLMQANEEGQEP